MKSFLLCLLFAVVFGLVVPLILWQIFPDSIAGICVAGQGFWDQRLAPVINRLQGKDLSSTSNKVQVPPEVESKPTVTPGLSRAQMELYEEHAKLFALASEENRRYHALIQTVNTKFCAGDYQGALKELSGAGYDPNINHAQQNRQNDLRIESVH